MSGEVTQGSGGQRFGARRQTRLRGLRLCGMTETVRYANIQTASVEQNGRGIPSATSR